MFILASATQLVVRILLEKVALLGVHAGEMNRRIYVGRISIDPSILRFTFINSSISHSYPKIADRCTMSDSNIFI